MCNPYYLQFAVSKWLNNIATYLETFSQLNFICSSNVSVLTRVRILNLLKSGVYVYIQIQSLQKYQRSLNL